MSESANPSAVGHEDFETFVFWERMRIVYNVVLALVVFALGPRNAWGLGSLNSLAWGAVAANGLYCTAHVAEFYLRRFGVSREFIPFWRFLIFAGGTGFAVLLAVLALTPAMG